VYKLGQDTYHGTKGFFWIKKNPTTYVVGDGHKLAVEGSFIQTEECNIALVFEKDEKRFCVDVVDAVIKERTKDLRATLIAMEKMGYDGYDFGGTPQKAYYFIEKREELVYVGHEAPELAVLNYMVEISGEIEGGSLFRDDVDFTQACLDGKLRLNKHNVVVETVTDGVTIHFNYQNSLYLSQLYFSVPGWMSGHGDLIYNEFMTPTKVVLYANDLGNHGLYQGIARMNVSAATVDLSTMTTDLDETASDALKLLVLYFTKIWEFGKTAVPKGNPEHEEFDRLRKLVAQRSGIAYCVNSSQGVVL